MSAQRLLTSPTPLPQSLRTLDHTSVVKQAASPAFFPGILVHERTSLDIFVHVNEAAARVSQSLEEADMISLLESALRTDAGVCVDPAHSIRV